MAATSTWREAMRRGLGPVLMLFVAPPAFAAGVADTDVPAAFAACDRTTAARLAFVEDRLEEGRPYAAWWWRGFTGFYAIGTVVSSVDAALENDGGERANAVVSAVKALGGTVRLWFFRPLAREGAMPLLTLPVADEAECRERLVRAEDLLRGAAAEVDGVRHSWVRHATIVGVNVAGALIVAEGFDEPGEAWLSAGIGIAVGQLMTWTHPWRAAGDLDAYEQTFDTGVPAPTPVTWAIAPTAAGARLELRF